MFGTNLYILFLVLAAIFGGMAIQDFVKNARKFTPAAKVRLRMALIFLAVGLYLLYQSMAD